MKTKAKEAGTEFVTKAINGIKELPSKMKTWLDTAKSKVTTWVSEMGAKARECGTTMINNIKSGLSGLGNALYQIGKKAVNSLINGIKSMASNISSSIGSFVQGIINGVTGGKDDGIITVSHEYDLDSNSKPTTVWSYGKDVAKTISLASIDTSPSSYANSSYISSSNNNTYASYLGKSFNQGGSSGGDNELLKMMAQLLTQQQPNIVIDVHDNTVRDDNDIDKLTNEIMKKIDFITRVKNKKY